MTKCSGSTRRRWCVTTLSISFVVLLVTMPGLLCPGDSATVRVSTQQWLENGRFDVPEALAGSTGARGQYYHQHPRNGLWYPKYGFANTLLYAIPMAVERGITGRTLGEFGATAGDLLVRTTTLNLFNLVLALGIVAYTYGLGSRLGDDCGTVALCVLACVFGTATWYHLRAQTMEIFQIGSFTGLCFHLDALSRTTSSQQRHLHLSASMAFVGMLVLLKLSYVPLLPLVLLAVGASTANDSTDGTGPLRKVSWTSIAAAGAWTVAISVALLALNWWRFGSPWTTGYAQWTAEREFLSGTPLTAARGFAVDPRASVFLHHPFLVLGIVGLPIALPRMRVALAFAWVAFASSFVVACLFVNWRGEWAYGPRYLVFATTVLPLPMIALFDAVRSKGRAASVALGVFVSLVLVWSVRRQWTVNRMPFFAANLAELHCTELGESVDEDWFRERSVWDIDRALLRTAHDGVEFPPLRGTAPTDERRAVEQRLVGLTAPNLYWPRLIAFRSAHAADR